jgi:hypothetical protein
MVHALAYTYPLLTGMNYPRQGTLLNLLVNLSLSPVYSFCMNASRDTVLHAACMHSD